MGQLSLDWLLFETATISYHINKFCQNYYVYIKEIGVVYNVRVFLPFCSPGFHLGHNFKTLIISLSKASRAMCYFDFLFQVRPSYFAVYLRSDA